MGPRDKTHHALEETILAWTKSVQKDPTDWAAAETPQDGPRFSKAFSLNEKRWHVWVGFTNQHQANFDSVGIGRLAPTIMAEPDFGFGHIGPHGSARTWTALPLGQDSHLFPALLLHVLTCLMVSRLASQFWKEISSLAQPLIRQGYLRLDRPGISLGKVQQTPHKSSVVGLGASKIALKRANPMFSIIFCI